MSIRTNDVRGIRSGIDSIFILLALLFFLIESMAVAQALTGLVVDTYAVNGSYSWTAPDGVTSAYIEVQGSGGGSGGCVASSNTAGGGGGGGGFAAATMDLTPGASYIVFVGNNGLAGASGDNDGGTGGTSSFSNSTLYINATGGGGGLKGSTGTGGAAGTGLSNVAGAIIYVGGNGTNRNATVTNRSGVGGGGASAYGNGSTGTSTAAGIGAGPRGGVGGAIRTSSQTGLAGVLYSAGAGGASCTSTSSRAGAAGTVGIVSIAYQNTSLSGFPRLKSYTANRTTANGLWRLVNMSLNFSAGDLLLLVMSSDGTRNISVTDYSWTRLHQQARAPTDSTPTQAVFYKVSNGTETTLNVTVNATEMTSHIVLAIADAGAPTSSYVNGSSTNANPPSHDAGVSANYMWIAAASWDDSANSGVTLAPSGFSSFITAVPGALTGAITAVATQLSETQTLDPGTFTSVNEQWVASTIAIPYNATRYLVTNITANLSVVLANDTSTLLNETSQTGIVQALIKHSSKERGVAVLELNFTANLDLSSLRSDVDVENRKSYVHGYASINEILNISLLIPRVSGSGSVFICPGAESIEQVNTSCAGLVNINTGETADGISVSEVSYGGNDYYLVSNITGTGGGEADASNLLQCFFIQNITCPSGTSKLIGVKNDSGGYNNAHAQNNTLNTYNYSLCCNSTNASITITAACPGDDTVIRLSNTNNSHVELGSLSAYPYLACLASDWKRINCEYPTGSCAANYACILSMANSEGNNQTNAHIGDCSSYDQKVCCALTNFAPAAPILRNPTDANTTVFERKVNFNWSASIDPDGDSVSYILNASCGSCSAGCYEPLISSIATTNYTVPNALCVDVDYNWTVSACDAYGDCNASSIFTFRIASVADLILTVNTTSFGTMALGQNNDTTDDSPPPMIARNIGNVLLNVTINATNLFTTAGMDGYHFQFKADEQEPGSYAQSCSQHTAFAFMSNVTPKTLFCNLSYVDANDEGQIEYNLTVPISEPPGAKSSYIEVSYVKSE